MFKSVANTFNQNISFWKIIWSSAVKFLTAPRIMNDGMAVIRTTYLIMDTSSVYTLLQLRL